MTAREARNRRRAEERKAAKLARKSNPRRAGLAPLSPVGFVSHSTPEPSPAPSEPSLRTVSNRANAQHSTGPKTSAGRLASSGNSLKHGLSTGQLLIPGEDAAGFDALQNALFAEHEPANPTEELLVAELARSYWLMQRAIRLQNECFTENGIDEKRLALFLRYQTTHERRFHKALSVLLKLKKEARRGFVSQNGPQQPEIGFVSQNSAPEPPELGFVSQNRPVPVGPGEFVRQNDPAPMADAA